MVRQPAVAGQFYPGRPQDLLAAVRQCLDPEAVPSPARLAICPHAGYIYSGPTAGKTFSRVVIPRRVIVVGPNHRGAGAAAAVMSQGQWLTPLGPVPLDAELGQRLLAGSRLLSEDARAHQMEHSLEVQVPFLQVLQPDLLLLPICLGWLDFDQCAEIGHDLAKAIAGLGEPVLMVASTDMTHYESAAAARAKDSQALERVIALDPRGLYETVRGRGISMCGVLPTTTCLAAALELGAKSAELVEYTNSGAATGDFAQVVGYAGLIVR
ncbi:MAG: AmmeMemoRadiSam system protein B, partial [Desulfarculus sp.]|nr:AmmeMemoRadiSam system protein B [Desulfarculus sp.]